MSFEVSMVAAPLGRALMLAKGRDQAAEERHAAAPGPRVALRGDEQAIALAAAQA